MGSVLALTDNADLNVLLCQNWREIYGRRKVFRWGPSDDAHASSDGDGTRIWETLPRPMAVSSELFRNEARVFTQVGAIHSLDGDVTALLSVGKGGVQFGSVSRPDSSDARVTLLLRRTAAPLVRAVRPELVVTLDTSEPAEVARLVVDSVAGRVPESCRESIRAILSGKDENLLLGLGNGVAVPHLYADEIEGPACVIVRLPNGLAGIPPPDGHALNLIFLLISPVGDPELHLNALAAVASLAGDPEKRQALLTAPTPEEVVQVVRGSPIHPIPKL